MEWLNTSVTFINSPEFQRSRFEQRGIWLTLMGWCVQQENGGRIEGTGGWKEWDWQQVLRVPARVVKQDSPLWHWTDGEVLVLHGYPVEKEREVRAKREAGRKGGLSSGEARSKHAASSASSTASTERKGKERKGNRKGSGKGMEGEGGGAAAPDTPPALEQWLEHAARVHPDWPELDARSAWAHYQAAGWTLPRGKLVDDWRACAVKCHALWLKGGAENLAANGRAAAPAAAGFDPDRPNAHTGGMEDATEVPAAAGEVAP